MDPTAELLHLPEAYGIPKTTLDWESVRDRFQEAERYWLATTRPDGRPHVIPIDGVWQDDRWYFGGAPKTVSMRNLGANQEIAVHLEDTMQAVIVEGPAEWVTPSPDEARRLVEASKRKYGYALSPEDYARGVWSLRPRRALAWTQFPKDCTRFTFA
jgi:Pyridoxamine 5'-phosphate oxidase